MSPTSSTSALKWTSSSRSSASPRSPSTTRWDAAPPAAAALRPQSGTKSPSATLLEHLHRKILGTDARGSPADGPFDHSTGQGYVAERRGDYYDALKVKKLKVIPLVMETLGGIGHPGRGFLGRLANMGDPKKGGARDNTQYTCWTAPSFAAHHGMCISAE